jgi:tetratricopeptide (TPR) repeat protein
VDSLIAAAARALAAGDPLGALKRVALREDPPALALRGIAMAQLGDHDRARKLLRRAAQAFGPGERLERARCQVAEAEIALAARDLRWPARTLDAAARALEALDDHDNALHARLVGVRRLLVLGQLDEADEALARLEIKGVRASLAAVFELCRAEIALRRVRATEARAALDRAREAAVGAGIPALIAEVDRAARALSAPSARLVQAGSTRTLRLDEVEAVFASGALVIDACRRMVTSAPRSVALANRPVLFALVRALDVLIEGAFAARTANASHRARLRVEVGRLRSELRLLARVDATRRGFALVPLAPQEIVVLAPPVDGPAGAVLALLEGGEPWSTSALACALGGSQRTVQRALRELEASSAVRSVGRGRARRWLAPAPEGFATTLLLPGALPMG